MNVRAVAAMAAACALMAIPAGAQRAAEGPMNADRGRALVAAADGPRLRLSLNDGWRYADGDIADAASPSHDDAGWVQVGLPHTWNAEDAVTEAVTYRRGVGWYRRPLVLDPSLRGRRIFLYFEGANQVADVFVNGLPAGRHIGGYTAFAFDVTARVRFDAPNTLAVRVDNAHDDDIPPLNADFTFYGGLYRDVWLIATSPVHIDVLDHASPGVYVDTPEVSAAEATVRIRGNVVNHGARVRRITVENRVLDPEGREVAVSRSVVRVPPAGATAFEQHAPRIDRPRLWSPDEPNLYRVVTELRAADTLLDRTSNPLGFRWFRIDPEHGFFLNDRPLSLYGTNRHQDRSGYGNALADGMHQQDVEIVKATGFNFLRLAHYPQDPAVLEAMDRRGVIGWEEIPVVNIISQSPAFADNAERMLVEMIRQHYNHPSIVFWGYMNEVLLRKPAPMRDDYIPQVRALAERLEARVRAEDPTRATVIAVSFDEIDDGSGLQDIPHVLGLNLYFGWYYRTLDGFGTWVDSLHARNPTRPLIISEYGADSDERIHTLEPRAFDFSTEHQQRFHEATFRQIRERPWIIGSAVWNQFDFGSKGRHDSKPNVNQKGLLYLDRRPKDIWHFYRAALLREPVLHIATRDWPVRAGSRPGDERQPVVVYTNQSQVELRVNGVSLGSRSPEHGVVHWTVQLQPGQNRLHATGRPAHGPATGAAQPATLPLAGAPLVEDRVVDVLDIMYVDRTPFFRHGGSRDNIMAVNAGSHTQYIDASGTVWEADRPYVTGGSWGHVGGEPRLRHHRIFGTEDDALYQSQRAGAQQYRFDVPDGTYEVRLRFAEIEHDAGDVRRFDVVVNGQPVVRSLDLAGAHGRYRAVERAAVVDATGDTGVTIAFEHIAGTPVISGILLRRR